MERKTIILLIGILILASFFRLYQLELIPPGLYPDEAINSNQAITEPGKIFYPENNGREGLHINLLALSFAIFGISIWSIKIVSALIGILTVYGIYLLGQEMFNKKVALFSSFFLAVSFWHINFSRIGFRAILVPLILVFSFYYIFKGFKNNNQWNFIIAGLIFGLGFYTYIGFRTAVLMVLIGFALKWFLYHRQKKQKEYFKLVASFIIAAIIIALPIGMYFIQHPEDFISRATGVSVFAQDNPLLSFAKSLFVHLGMFNFYGDANWRHNLSTSPQLFFLVGILFIVGILLSTKEAISQRSKTHGILLAWFFVMLLPGILTDEGIPHALRCIGAIPAVCLLAGFGAWKTNEYLKKKVKKKQLAIINVIFFLVVIGFQFNKYFFVWAQPKETQDAFTQEYVKMGNYLNSYPDKVKYVIANRPGVMVNNLPMPVQTVMFIEHTHYNQSIYLLPEDIDKIKEPDIVVFMQYDKDLIKQLKQKFPQALIYYE